MVSQTRHSGMLEIRQELVDILWDMVEKNHFVAPFIEMLVRQIIWGSIKNPYWRQYFRKWAHYGFYSLQRITQSWEQIFPPAHQSCDVLFVPISKRSNYLSGCQLVTKALFEQDKNIKVGMVEFGRDFLRKEKCKQGDRMLQYTLSLNSIVAKGCLKEAEKLLSVIAMRLEKHSFYSEFLLTNQFQLLSWLALYMKKVDYVKGWLERIQSKIVITMNEQDTSSSIFVTAARMSGIKCHQILHGIPARFYWPFVSEKTWVWGPISQKALIEYGAPEESLPIIGNLEVTHWLATESHKKKVKTAVDDSSVRNLLFFSQLLGLDLYNAPDFVNALDVIAKVFSRIDHNWNLTIRMHPCDREKSLQMVRDKLGFLGERLTISQGSFSLLEDSMNADFACTCSSTAILTPLVMDIPCALLWGDDMDRLFGRPFLPPKYVARNANELKELIDAGQTMSRDEIEDEMLANLETADKVAADYIVAGIPAQVVKKITT